VVWHYFMQTEHFFCEAAEIRCNDGSVLDHVYHSANEDGARKSIVIVYHGNGMYCYSIIPSLFLPAVGSVSGVGGSSW
jgi:hypothetical protein